uniref:SFRICE_041270 n=1 Tax=Spodoptera frugiperda TaxID=7108 RepID=A0A2H1V932_SPOFR
MLRPAQTRWLSLLAVVERILEQWEALKLYFDDKWLEDHECREIHTALRDPIQKAYFYFLSWMLPKFTRTNAYFQSENTVLLEMHLKMQELYRELLLLIMPSSYVNNTPLDSIDPTDERKHIRPEDIYLGLGVQKQLSLPEVIADVNSVKQLRENCKRFIVQAAVGIRKRYSLDDKLFIAVSNFNNENCMFATEKRQTSLASTFNLLPRISPKKLDVQQILDDEWRYFPNYIAQNKCDLDVNDPLDVFWHKVSEIKTKEDSRSVGPFYNLAHFMLGMLSLPHSNADCERIFSHITDLKTKKRNQLSTKSIAGNLYAATH